MKVDLNILLDKESVIKVNYKQMKELETILDSYSIRNNSVVAENNTWKKHTARSWYGSTMCLSDKEEKSHSSIKEPFILLHIHEGVQFGSGTIFNQKQQDEELNNYPKNIIEYKDIFFKNDIIKMALTDDGYISLELNPNKEYELCMLWENNDEKEVLESFAKDGKKAEKAYQKAIRN